MPSTSTRGAANSIANGKPSSRRQIATTSGALASVSAKSSTIAVTRSTNSCTAGKAAASVAVSPGDGSGLSSGPRRCTRSPGTPSGSRLVARIVTPERSAENRRRQTGRRVDDVLAIVEQQQHPAVL